MIVLIAFIMRDGEYKKEVCRFQNMSDCFKYLKNRDVDLKSHYVKLFEEDK